MTQLNKLREHRLPGRWFGFLVENQTGFDESFETEETAKVEAPFFLFCQAADRVCVFYEEGDDGAEVQGW